MNTSVTQFVRIFEKIKNNYVTGIIKFGSLTVLIIAAFILYELQDYYVDMYYGRISGSFSNILIGLSMFLIVFKAVYLVYFFNLFLKYKPVSDIADDDIPSCTVIVPAYNEGRLVYDTLKSIAESDFPTKKMQVIAIDDGSKDDTWKWICKAKSDLVLNLEILQQPENMGKRQALYRGFKMATGEILVTIDSDSIVRPDTIRNLVSPFVTDSNCGAVAGNVKVLNTQNAIIPKMLNVSFAYSFEFIRAAQSVLGSVLCTPGALSAYKKTAVMNCLETWINQTFMGVKTDIGEDRAMTNMILKQGYHVLFQQNAHVLTKIPENFNSLRKMFTRWERSNVRENIMMSQFAFGNFRVGPKAGARLILVNQWLKILLAVPTIIFMIIFSITNPLLYISVKLVSILILSTIPAFYFALNYSKSTSLWAYSYGIFYAFLLFWITPYAILTANKKGWLTRGL